MRIRKTIFAAITLALARTALSDPAEGKSDLLSGYPTDQCREIRSVQFPTFGWVKRTLSKEPVYASENVKYSIWVLGNGKKSVMVMAWDESGGTGTGYDTLYADKNLNGNLTDPDERQFWPNTEAKTKKKKHPFEKYDVTGVKEKDGKKVFNLHLRGVYANDRIQYNSTYNCIEGENRYQVGPLPAEHILMWSDSLETAPIYNFGGDAVPNVNKVWPGESLGTWQAGLEVGASMITAHIGFPKEAQLRFYGSKVPSLPEAMRNARWGKAGYPLVYLRVLNEDRSIREVIRFGDSCPCAGGFAPRLGIPSRVPPGEHVVVARLLRQAQFGGPADFLYPVTIKNDNYGKPMLDPAFNNLRERFAEKDVKFASLRRVDTALGGIPSYPEEKIVPTRVYDNELVPNTRDWNPSGTNRGRERTLWIGKRLHHQADCRSLLQFDLSGFPKDSEILGAHLRLGLLNRRFSGLEAGQEIQAYAVRREWNEVPTDGEWAAWNGPKWKGKSGEAWGKGGCADTKLDRFSDPAGSVDAGGFPLKLDPADKSRKAPLERVRVVSLDLSTLVKEWHKGKVPNHGVLLVTSDGGVVVGSSEFMDYPYRPTLVVAYRGAEPKPLFHKEIDEAAATEIIRTCTSGTCPLPSAP
jgi:hypothetical protein